MADSTDPRPVSQLISDLTRDSKDIVRKEFALMRAEVVEILGRVAKGGGEALAGAICLFLALVIVLQALIVALAEWIGAGWASLLIGVLVAAIGALLIWTGTKHMAGLTPERSSRQVEKDATVTKEHI